MIALFAKFGRSRLLVAAGLLSTATTICLTPTQALAQQAPAAVDANTAARLVWTTLIGLDQANSTGNYSVLRDLGAPGFAANNSAATLAATFQSLRTQQVDLGQSLLIAPTYDFPPSIVQNGMLRIRGSFALRPVGIAFDLLFMSINGQWRLFGVAVIPLTPQPPAPAARSSIAPTRR